MTDSMNHEASSIASHLNQRYPEPTVREPEVDELEMMVFDGVCSATDGCEVEPDGICPHGHASWLMYLGFC